MNTIIKVQQGPLAKTVREWGSWEILLDNGNTKIKELSIFPGKKLSYQRHFKRAEFWFVSEGACTIKSIDHEERPIIPFSRKLKLHQYQNIPVGIWHIIRNHTDKLCKVIEIQYGSECEETDIERHK